MRSLSPSHLGPAAAWALALGACAGPPPEVPARPDEARYADPSLWLCLPGRDDVCHGDLAATVIRPDGARSIEPERLPASTPRADCFYVYPTVDMGLVAGNHDDLKDVKDIAFATVSQAARFRETCELYVPLYRQVTIGAYVAGGDQLEKRLAFAYSDVEEAFRHYLSAFDRGRPIVLLGHSQGAEMVTRLLRRFFDRDPAMRARLLLALVIGGNVEVPKGRTVGATFESIPICTRAGETGCVIAYRSYEEGATVNPGRAAPAPGDETACVNPADVTARVDHDRRPFAGAYVPIRGRLRNLMRGIEGVTTPFVDYPDLYAGRCAEGPSGYRYLAISMAGGSKDLRKGPIDLDAMPFKGVLGLHLVDFQIPQRDLIDRVAERVAASK